MTQRLRIKVFEESRVVARVPGAAPGEWVTRSRTTPVDEAVSAWLAETGSRLVACSAPGFHVQWLDREMTTRAVIVAVTVTYEAPSESRPDQPPPSAGPAGPGAPAPTPPAKAELIRDWGYAPFAD